MSYAQNGLIEATDFNTLVGGNPETGANKLNTVWATGGTTAGYGQTAVSQVAGGDTVIATGQWNALVANTASAAAHSGSSNHCCNSTYIRWNGNILVCYPYKLNNYLH
jgi:hypothetical protein